MAQLRNQLSSWFTCWKTEVLSESDSRIRSLLQHCAPVVKDRMEDAGDPGVVGDSGRGSQIRLYVAGPPCQPFSFRNVKRKKWEDPRCSTLRSSFGKVKQGDADIAVIENSATLLH